MSEEIRVQQTSGPTRRKRERGQHGLGNVYEHRANWWLDVKIKGERHRMKLGPVKLLEKREADVLSADSLQDFRIFQQPASTTVS